MSFTIREAHRGDGPALAALLTACGLSTHAILWPGTRYWLAEGAAGAVEGAVGLELGAEAVLLRSAAVLPERRGAGIGAALTRAAIAAAGDAAVYLFSTGAGPYWQRLGFVEVPVDELVAALPDAPQVRHYAERGWLPDEVAWVLSRGQGTGHRGQGA
jgi:N-acetylglutamate synthase-like GNAT family acetyltransferase